MRKRVSLIAVVLCVMLVSTLGGCGKEEDAKEYTKAILELSFQGDMQRAQEVMKDATQESLQQQHQSFISSFVAGNIANEMELNELKTAEFSDLIARIFSVMRYNVGEVKKTGTKEYEVSVTIHPSDIFLTFQERIIEDSEKIAEKVRSGGYQGTEEEVSTQVMQDIVNHSYELLEVSYREGDYAKPIKVPVTVKADEKKAYSISTAQMEELVVKILQLDKIDEIQG